MTARASSRSDAIWAASRDSTLSRSSGSVFDARTFTHQQYNGFGFEQFTDLILDFDPTIAHENRFAHA